MRRKGFVLAMAILLLAMVSVTLLYWLEALWLYRESCHMIERKNKNFYALEKQAYRLIANIQSKQNDCIVTAAEPTVILHKLGLEKTCRTTLGKRQFNYLIEDLGVFPCHLIFNKDHWEASHHLRLSIVEKEQSNMALQIRYANTISSDLPCEHHKMIQLHSKILSYRYVNVDMT